MADLELNDSEHDSGDQSNTNTKDAGYAYDIDNIVQLSLKAKLAALGLHAAAPTGLLHITTTLSPYLHSSPALPGHALSHHPSPYGISAPNLPLPPSQYPNIPLNNRARASHRQTSCLIAASDSGSGSFYVLPLVSTSPGCPLHSCTAVHTFKRLRRILGTYPRRRFMRRPRIS